MKEQMKSQSKHETGVMSYSSLLLSLMNILNYPKIITSCVILSKPLVFLIA